MELEPGQLLEDKYRIVRLLGEGGMGAVYEGENTLIRRRVAIKVLHGAVVEHSEALSRFEREAQAAGQIGSEHITEVLDLGRTAAGERFMVMEFLQGETLGARLQDLGRLTPAEAAPIVDQLLEGLGAAHQAGIIHRDLKPENIFLVRNKAGLRDFVKILDFGVSKFASAREESLSMTTTGMVVGTPYYMSPEQARGTKAIDARSDLFAVGVILYEIVAGQVPFHAETFNELLFKIALEDPLPLEQLVAGIDGSFVEIVRRAMARRPEERFPNADAFRDAIGAWALETNTSLKLASSLRPGLSSYPPPASLKRFASRPDVETVARLSDFPVLSASLESRPLSATFSALAVKGSEASDSHPWVHTNRSNGIALPPRPSRRWAQRIAFGAAALVGLGGLVGGMVVLRKGRSSASGSSVAAPGVPPTVSIPAFSTAFNPLPSNGVPSSFSSIPPASAIAPTSQIVVTPSTTGKARRAPADLEKGKRIIRDQL